MKTKTIRIVTVVKRTGIVWFEHMEEGIKQFAAQNGVDATISHTTVANNRDGYVFLDVGVLLRAGTNADGSARGATAMIGDRPMDSAILVPRC